ncbi:MAG TPA: DUF423 domain-containing protein [Planctomicrobium sp.]|nr:DUF423 domain-containing protein [Planctomicrobium sp.]
MLSTASSAKSKGLCWIQLGAILAGLSVVTGAFAAHGLEDYLLKLYDEKTHVILGVTIPSAQKYLGDFKTAAEYQMYHSLALVLTGLLALNGNRRSLTVAAISFLIGIVLFSGSLYVLVLTGIRWLGAITPLGGTAFLIGWTAMAIAAWKMGRNKDQ